VPPFISRPRADRPYKNRADLPECHELRATVIAALFFRVSRLNNLFSNLKLWNTISIWNSNVITMEQLANNLFSKKLFYLEAL
jgi:hypothetical protein